ncbi:MAG: hypothetical protein V1721_02675, partial [Pseudomonadota bacterium]
NRINVTGRFANRAASPSNSMTIPPESQDSWNHSFFLKGTPNRAMTLKDLETTMVEVKLVKPDLKKVEAENKARMEEARLLAKNKIKEAKDAYKKASLELTFIRTEELDDLDKEQEARIAASRKKSGLGEKEEAVAAQIGKVRKEQEKLGELMKVADAVRKVFTEDEKKLTLIFNKSVYDIAKTTDDKNKALEKERDMTIDIAKQRLADIRELGPVCVALEEEKLERYNDFMRKDAVVRTIRAVGVVIDNVIVHGPKAMFNASTIFKEARKNSGLEPPEEFLPKKAEPQILKPSNLEK